MKALRSLIVAALGVGAALEAQEPTPQPPPPGQRVIGFYTGTLPCADCSGILTELTLFSHDGSGRASYWLKETYLGKPAKDATFESGGSWVVEPFREATQRTVYRLVEARSAESRFFLKVSDDELRMLDRSGRTIQSNLNYMLKRQPLRR